MFYAFNKLHCTKTGLFASGQGWLLTAGDDICTNGTTIDPFAPIPYATRDEAIENNALLIDVGRFFESTLTFVLTLLNICARTTAHALGIAHRRTPLPATSRVPSRAHLVALRTCPDWFFGCVQQTELAETYVRKVYTGVTDAAAKEGGAIVASAGLDVKKLQAKMHCLDSTQSIIMAEESVVAGAPLPDVAEEESFAQNGGAASARGASLAAGASGIMGTPYAERALKAVDGATSVEDGMQQLYKADPMLFYMQGEQIRRGAPRATHLPCHHIRHPPFAAGVAHAMRG